MRDKNQFLVINNNNRDLHLFLFVGFSITVSSVMDIDTDDSSAKWNYRSSECVVLV